jgi:hypothetical protein
MTELPASAERVLTAADVAALVQCSENYAYLLIKREMPFRKVGVLLRVTETDFWKWFNSQRHQPIVEDRCDSTNAGQRGGAASRGTAARRSAGPLGVKRARPPCSLPSDGSANAPTPITQPRRPRRSAAR